MTSNGAARATSRAPSLQHRLVIAVAALTTVAIAIVGVALYGAAKRGAWQQFDEALRGRAEAICGVAEHDEDGYEMELPPLQNAVATAYLPDGNIATTVDRRFPPTTVLARSEAYGISDVRFPDKTSGRAIQLRCMPRDETGGAKPITLIVAERTDSVAVALDAIKPWFVAIALIAVLATSGIALLLVRRALSPLPQLATAISRIDDTSLDQRLSVAGQPAELVSPIDKLNDLLGRLSSAFARERQFTADVSHELRTPIAGLRTLLEVTALSERSTAEYKTALVDAQAIVVQLAALVDNLLLLARLDAGQVPLATTDVDLAELVADCWKPHAAPASARKLEFRCTIPASTRITVDREKLRSVLGNLLANAAEYTDEGGWIEVSSSPEALLSVTDSGPPIPREQLAKLFDRMWRGDASRGDTGVHCGIGLALARSLCAAMSLELTAETRDDGSVRFTVADPASRRIGR
ncbi:MAG TPA: ATP-binding protein [Kofleriaceae bacterium]|nr:ATP-binding protein [Kofleriaceae bacterium]